MSEVSTGGNYGVGETKVRKRRCEMTVKIKNGKLLIELDLHDATASASGKTLGVAGTQGRFQTSATIDGQPVWVIANAFIYPPSTAKKEEEEESKGKGHKAAAKQSSTKKKPVVVEEEEEEYEDDEEEN
jgi:hypothetical protein